MISATLGDIGRVCMCKRVLKEQTSSSGEIPFYKISTFGGQADTFISRELFEEYKSKYNYPKKGDVLISAAGTLGRTVIFDGEESYFQDSNIVWINNDETKVLNEYLYYFYKIIKWKKTSGSTIDRLYNDNISGAEIYYPKDLNDQRRIIAILKSLDSKISINNKIINDVDDYAKLLYEHWFLQFDFLDNNNKPYKSSGGIMMWDETIKTEIPSNWSVKSVKDVIQHINTGLNPRDNFVLNDGDIKYVTVKNLNTSGLLDFSGCDTISEKTKALINKRSKLSQNDILFASIAPLGRCYLVQEEPKTWEINESVFSIRPNNMINSEYLYMYFMSDYFIKKAENSSTGSIFAGIRVNVLENMPILVPDTQTLDRFHQIVSPLFKMRFIAEKQNNELYKTSLFLLPMLMSGQVSLK